MKTRHMGAATIIVIIIIIIISKNTKVNYINSIN